MHLRLPQKQRRRGATVIEFAVVAVVLFPLLFSLLEYCRYVFVRQLLENAAREGARYAVVHTYDNTTAQIQAIVVARMAGQENNVSGFTIQVYRSDPDTGVYLGPWTDAKFGETITVQITGNYLPLAGWMQSTLPIDVRAVMASEAN
jgi:Flp pilus assembly protein TadG